MAGEARDPGRAVGGAVRTGAIASLVFLWWSVIETVYVLAVLVAAVFLPPLIVFVVGAALLLLIELGCCTWVDGNWGQWTSRSGAAVEAKLRKWREGRVMRHPVRWITEGSAGLYVLAALITSPTAAVTVARVVGAQRVGRSRIVWTAVIYAIVVVAFLTAVGWGVHEGEQAIT